MKVALVSLESHSSEVLLLRAVKRCFLSKYYLLPNNFLKSVFLIFFPIVTSWLT